MCCKNYTWWYWLWCHHSNILVSRPLPSQMKNASFLAPESNRLSCASAVKCPYIYSHPLNEQQEQITIILEGAKLWFYIWMERDWSPFCCQWNVTVDIAWNFVMRVRTVQNFSVPYRKSLQRYCIFCDFTSFWGHIDIRSPLICII